MSLKGYIINDEYTETNFKTDFHAKFPEFTSIDSDPLLDLSCDILPYGLSDYLEVASVRLCVFYTVAHLCAYFDLLNAANDVKSVLRNASSMTASSLTISYSEIAKLKGEIYSNLNDFLHTTSYGRLASLYLEKIVGSPGGVLI